MSTNPRRELEQLADLLGQPLDLRVCPETGTLRAFFLSDVQLPAGCAPSAERRRGAGGRRRRKAKGR